MILLLVVDMRYMINMDYSADLPINTMGRRIRTRLYFTSESHLHTVLNVLRFAGEDAKKSLLSEHGIQVINATPELCYLTQIVLRVFEDGRREIDDPRRYRVEILFSPGATATPLHINEMDREMDTSRFDTAPLQMIGREGLTAEEVEDFFEKAIMAGGGQDEHEVASLSTVAEAAKMKVKATKSPRKKKMEPTITTETASSEGMTSNDGAIDKEMLPIAIDSEKKSFAVNGDVTPEVKVVEPAVKDAVDSEELTSNDRSVGNESDDSDKERSERIAKIVARKYFWSTVAIGSFVLGVGCLFMALNLSRDSRQRRWSTRRY